MHKGNESIVCNAMFNLHKVSLLRNSMPISLLSKANTYLKFSACTRISWSCMKLRLFHNLELLRYKMIKTGTCIQQRWSSWKSTREGRINFNLLKNLFVYIFTLSVYKICTPQSENKTEDSQTVYELTLHYLLPLYAPVCFWNDPPAPFSLPPYVLYG